jgi:hypothetical protein
VRELLRLFGERNRDFEVVGRVEGELAAAGLRCDPPFRAGTLDSVVRIGPVGGATEPDDTEDDGGRRICRPRRTCGCRICRRRGGEIGWSGSGRTRPSTTPGR